jgi:hypothetical protein
MPSRPRKTPIKPTKNSREPAEANDATLADLLERAERIRQTSGHLVGQMRELASEIAEAGARAEDRASGSAGE